MESILFLALLVAVATASKSMNETYLITAPKMLRPGVPLDVTVNILTSSGDVHVTAFVRMGKGLENFDISNSSGVFRQGNPEQITLDIPYDLEEARYAKSYYYLQVEGTGGLVFTDQVELQFEQKSMSIFVQTDKSIYKPGQTVNFRVFCLNQNMTVYTEPMDIWIGDPNGNRIKQFLGERDDFGVVTKSIVIDTHPVLGFWKINVTVPGSSTVKTFRIGEYVLPKFEVSLELPPYILTSEETLTGTIHAKYTFGKPLKGKAVLRLHTSYYYDPWMINEDEHTVDVDGSTSFTIPLTRLQDLEPYSYRPVAESLNDYQLTVDISVTETINNITVNASDSTTFYTQALKLEFLSTNDRKFKPGLPNEVTLQLTSQDGSPVSSKKDRVKVVTFVTYSATSSKRRHDYRVQKVMKLSEEFYAVPTSGFLHIPVVNTMKEATNIHIKAEYGKVSATFDLEPYTGNSIALTLKTPDLEVGQNAIFEVESTEAMPHLFYQIMARGNVVKEERVDIGGKTVTNITFLVTSQMSPSAKIVVYYMSGNNVISETDEFDVDGLLQNQVSLSFDRAEAEPGDNISLAITADPQSVVNLLAVDQSVMILGTGNDVTHTQVSREMDSYNSASRSYYFYSPENNYYEISPRVFDRMGLAVITDITSFGKRRPYDYQHALLPKPMAVRIKRQAECPPCICPESVQRSSAGAGGAAMNAMASPPKVLKTVERTRTLFPETWLWTDTSIGADGRTVLNATVPDTITSWIATAFAMNKDTGLGMTKSPAKLTTFRPFFVNLNLPYSVIRGEQVAIQANVFNYMATPVNVVVTLEKSDDYQNILIDNAGVEQFVSKVQTQNIHVGVGEAKSVFFPIVTKSLGQIDINVKAQSAVAADGLRRKLLVKPGGVEKEYSVPILVDLLNGKNFTQTVPISLPSNIVQDSERIRISAIGDYMGPSASNLDGLLRMPYGCGEQTMITFAPVVFVANYLEATDQMTPMIFDKVIWYLERGYQRELSYQHRDGSFSSFGERDRHGSTWLTAFVVKSFHQARQYVGIDEQVTIMALEWLLQQQRQDGGFFEPGTVHSQYLKGGSASEISRAAFVLISLVENNDTKGELKQRIDTAISRAVTYIGSRVFSLTDEYALSISAYALRLAGSHQYISALNKLNTLAVTEGAGKHWHKQVPEPRYYWSPPYQQSRPVDIEITSYALLTYAHLQDFTNGWPLLRWILSQRNNNGGFASTQDTILALQAMSEFAQLGFLASAVDMRNVSMDVSVTATNLSHLVSINSKNALVLQTYQPKTVPPAITIQASGKGLAIVQVGINFNVDRALIEPSFHVEVVLEEETLNRIVVKTCARYTKPGSSGMAIVELGIPSGFDADENSITNTMSVMKTEVKGQKLVLYFSQFNSTLSCFTMEATRVSMVAQAKPVAVQVYDYYQPTDQVTTFYLPQLLRDSKICDVCAECSCPKSTPFFADSWRDYWCRYGLHAFCTDTSPNHQSNKGETKSVISNRLNIFDRLNLLNHFFV
ncbi:hypothetical protein ScPMuIL_011348 [Solemya velum]